MKVLVAMSGGVDSSVAAALLKQQGHEVLGVTLKVWSAPRRISCADDPGPASPVGLRGAAPDDGAPEAENACCGAEAMLDAAGVARKLGIPHYILDYQDLFRREVVDTYVEAYRQGRTPNPCIACNDRVKFGPLLEAALGMDCEALATGHYARIEPGPDGALRLMAAADLRKDQTYFLYRLGQEQLRRLRFPLGGLDKPRVRALAAELGLKVAEKPESMELCFAPGGDHARALAALAPAGAAVEGPILDAAGRELGRHRGLLFYTIGQRRGLNLPGPEPRYVTALDPARNAVVVGGADELKRGGLTASSVTWTSGEPPAGPLRAKVKIRSAHPGAMATLHAVPGARAAVTFDEPQPAVTPGQAAVFYGGGACLGGGVIEASFS